MLYEELPRLDAAPVERWERWLAPALAGAAVLTAALLIWMFGQSQAAAITLGVGLIALPFHIFRKRQKPEGIGENVATVSPDYSLIGSTLHLCHEPAALTSSEGSLLICNEAYRELFGGTLRPLQLASDEESSSSLELVKGMAWRDGAGCAAGVVTCAGPTAVEVERVGSNSDMLLWRFPQPTPPDPLTLAAKRLAGGSGEKLGAAGVLAALVDADGILLAANQLFVGRAVPPDHEGNQLGFSDLIERLDDGQVRLVADGEAARPMKVVQVPVDTREEDGAVTYLFFEAHQGGALDSEDLQALLEILPIGLALVDRDGRFLNHESGVSYRCRNQGAGNAGLSWRPRRERGQGVGR